jgi:nucleotide-binding universal stress UspA family protein
MKRGIFIADRWQRGCSMHPWRLPMVRIQQILCPVDFSEFSRHAFDRAVGVARGYDAAIHVLHVLPMPTGVPAIPYGPEGPGPFRRELDRPRAYAELPRFLSAEEPVGAPIAYHVAEAPAAHKEILTEARRVAADLIVMGTHGRSGFERLLLGSVTEKVLRTSHVPVLTVPAAAPDVVAVGRGPFQRILYATDFSPGSEQALRYAASLAQHGAAQLILQHVVEPLPASYDPSVGFALDVGTFEAGLVESSRTKLREWVPEAIRLGCDTEDVVVRGKAYVEVLRLAAERQADLIVLGVHGRNALDRLVFGSTTEHVIRRAACPVLTVRQPE